MRGGGCQVAEQPDTSQSQLRVLGIFRGEIYAGNEAQEEGHDQLMTNLITTIAEWSLFPPRVGLLRSIALFETFGDGHPP